MGGGEKLNLIEYDRGSQNQCQCLNHYALQTDSSLSLITDF